MILVLGQLYSRGVPRKRVHNTPRKGQLRFSTSPKKGQKKKKKEKKKKKKVSRFFFGLRIRRLVGWLLNCADGRLIVKLFSLNDFQYY